MTDHHHPGSHAPATTTCPQTTPARPPAYTSFRTLRHPGHRLIKTLAILLLGATGLAALLGLIPAAGHDQLWFLLMAQRWLAGATLYGPQIFDSNTPAIVWLSAIPVALAQHLDLSPPFVAKLCVVLLLTAIATLSARTLRHLLPPLTLAQQLFLAFAAIVLFTVLPARDLGQRDPLTAVLCLPYVLAAALDASPPLLPLRLLSGLLAALGLCLKPQLTLIPLAVEATLLLRNTRDATPWRHRLRSLTRRPEPLLLLLAGALFLAAIHRFAPLYIAITLPILLSTYWAIGHLSPLQLLTHAPELHLLAALTVTLVVLHHRSHARDVSLAPAPFRRAIPLLLAAAFAATAAYYLQGTGWYYQQLPALTFFGAALALELLPFLNRLDDRPVAHPTRPPLPRWLPSATAALVLSALTLAFHLSGYPFTLHPFTPDRAYAITTPDPAFFASLPPGTPVAILTTSVDDAIMPVFRYHFTWAQRTDNLWLLPAILRSTHPAAGDPPIPAAHRLSPARLAELTTLQRRWMVEDLRRWQPSLVLVDRCQDPHVACQELDGDGLRRHDNLLAFFLADPAFVRLWTHYRYLRSSGSYDAYTLASRF